MASAIRASFARLSTATISSRRFAMILGGVNNSETLFNLNYFVLLMSKIKEVTALEILDSRGNPTIEVTVKTETAAGIAKVPSGASTGKHEAWEFRDGGKRFKGKGVTKAIRNIHHKIYPRIKGLEASDQTKIDLAMLDLDGTRNKRNLGANAILGVSLACAVASANDRKMPLYQYLNQLLSINRKLALPKAYFNIINGGKHADNSLSFQEFMIVPQLEKFPDNLRAAAEIYHHLKKILQQKYGVGATTTGDEGGFAPAELKNAEQVLSLLIKAINQAGYKHKVKLALDAAASELYSKGKYKVDHKLLDKDQLLNYYLKLIKKFPIISIEDPFHQEDFSAFAELTRKTKDKLQIVADDLTVTNTERLQKAIKYRSGNCLLLKVNQIGTLTEALQAAESALKNKWKVMVSHRSGETEDAFIADLAVALGCSRIKAGAPCRGERTAKYNRLLKIGQELSS